MTDVASGNQALALLEETRFDIVLMDLNLPGLSGLETIRLIRAHLNPAIARIPVMVVSALVTRDDIQHSLNAGANAFLGKPYRPERLVAAVRSALRPSSAAADTSQQPEIDFKTEQEHRLLRDHAATLGPVMARHIVGLFVATVPSLLVTARQEFAAGRAANLVRLAHRIKSSAFTLGLQTMAHLAETLEATAEKGVTDPVESLIGQLERSIAPSIKSLQIVLDELDRQNAEAPQTLAIRNRAAEPKSPNKQS